VEPKILESIETRYPSQHPTFSNLADTQAFLIQAVLHGQLSIRPSHVRRGWTYGTRISKYMSELANVVESCANKYEVNDKDTESDNGDT
jgi:hypothetical protein